MHAHASTWNTREDTETYVYTHERERERHRAQCKSVRALRTSGRLAEISFHAGSPKKGLTLGHFPRSLVLTFSMDRLLNRLLGGWPATEKALSDNFRARPESSPLDVQRVHLSDTLYPPYTSPSWPCPGRTSLICRRFILAELADRGVFTRVWILLLLVRVWQVDFKAKGKLKRRARVKMAKGPIAGGKVRQIEQSLDVQQSARNSIDFFLLLSLFGLGRICNDGARCF